MTKVLFLHLVGRRVKGRARVQVHLGWARLDSKTASLSMAKYSIVCRCNDSSLQQITSMTLECCFTLHSTTALRAYIQPIRYKTPVFYNLCRHEPVPTSQATMRNASFYPFGKTLGIDPDLYPSSSQRLLSTGTMYYRSLLSNPSNDGQ